MKTLEEVQEKFHTWRSTRCKRGPIPEALWRDAASLLSAYSHTKIAKILQLNSNDLKRKSKQYGKETVQFCETKWSEVSVLAREQESEADQWTLTLEHPKGFHLRLKSPNFDMALCEGLIQAFMLK